jgi:HSP20 family molecular chaperone IbpA
MNFHQKNFDEWYKSRFGGKIGDVEQRGDEDFIYFIVHLPGIDPENFKVEVRDATVNISGQSERV